MAALAWARLLPVGLLVLGGSAAVLAARQLLQSHGPWWPARLCHVVDTVGMTLVATLGANTLTPDRLVSRRLVASLAVTAAAALILRVIPDPNDAAASRS